MFYVVIYTLICRDIQLLAPGGKASQHCWPGLYTGRKKEEVSNTAPATIRVSVRIMRLAKRNNGIVQR